MGTVITKTEAQNLLDKITSKEVYNDVLDFLVCRNLPFLFSKKEMKKIAEKAVQDAKCGKGIEIEDVRKMYPR